MHDSFGLATALLSGSLLGALFFGGLWWTVRQGLSSKRPALWFFASMILRTFVILSGFYLVGRDAWERLLVCLLGFGLARFIVTRLTRPSTENQRSPIKEAGHASQS